MHKALVQDQRMKNEIKHFLNITKLDIFILMKSSTIKNVYTILIFAFAQLVNSQSVAGNHLDNSRLRKIGSFRNLSTDNWVLTVSTSNSPVITLRLGDIDLTFYQRNGDSIYHLSKHTKNRTYEVFRKNRKIGLVVTTNEVAYNESACISKNDPFLNILSKDFTLHIEDLAYSDSFIKQSCEKISDEQKEELRSVISRELNPSHSSLVKCFRSEEFAKNIKNNQPLEVKANQVITRYINDISRLESGVSDLHLECENGDKAKYSPASSSIIFPIKNNKLTGDSCKTLGQVFSHEYLHHAGLTESETSQINDACPMSMTTGNSKSCTRENAKSTKNETQGFLIPAALKETTTKIDKENQKKINDKLQQEIKTAKFVPVQDADIQEITNPTTPERYNKSVDRVYTAMSTNLEKMAQPLNRAIAASVNTAEAATTTASSSSGKVQSTYKKSSLLETSSERSPASNSRASANQEYTVEEILADKYNVPVESVRAAAASSELPTAATTTPNTANSRQAKQQAPRGGNGREIAGTGSAGAGAGLNSATQGGVPGASVSSGARTPSTRNPASSGGGPVAQDNTIKQLGTFNEIRGEKYKRIQERYSDPTFGDELAQQGLAIEYQSKNMTIRIGDNRKALFRDDGKALKKVTGAK